MEKTTKTTKINLEYLAKWLPIEPSRKVDTEVKFTNNRSNEVWGHYATQRRFT